MNMSLYDFLILLSDATNKVIDLLLSLPLWSWGLAFVVALAFEYVQNQIFLHERKEIDKKINLTIKRRKNNEINYCRLGKNHPEKNRY